MGWLYMQSLKGHGTPQAYLDNQFNFESAEGRSKVLRSAIADDGNYYAAVEQVPVSTGERSVIAIICLVDHNPRASDGFIFGYKDQSESMGPCQIECPLDILDLLTPTSSAHALAWRERCRSIAAAQAAASPRLI